jgi:hypothetical protein
MKVARTLAGDYVLVLADGWGLVLSVFLDEPRDGYPGAFFVGARMVGIAVCCGSRSAKTQATAGGVGVELGVFTSLVTEVLFLSGDSRNF